MEKLQKEKEGHTKTIKEAKTTEEDEVLYCKVCSKSFGSKDKYNEHIVSKSHKVKETLYQSKNKNTNETCNTVNTNNVINVSTDKPAKVEKRLTAKDNYLICFVCNDSTSAKTDDLLQHLKEKHDFEFPAASCLAKPIKAIKLIVDKIFKYGACLYCDSQRFPSPKAIQNHMRDADHCKVNLEDLIEHFYRFYDKTKLKAAPERERNTKPFKLLKRLLLPKNKKEIIEEEEVEEVEEIDENAVVVEEEVNTKSNNKEKTNDVNDIDDYDFDEDELNDIKYVTMENGEIMLRDGTIVGNKMYKTAYKQKVRMDIANWKSTKQVGLMRIRMLRKTREMNKMNNKKKKFSHWNLTGSTKSNFTRVNTLHIVRKQVNC